MLVLSEKTGIYLNFFPVQQSLFCLVMALCFRCFMHSVPLLRNSRIHRYGCSIQGHLYTYTEYNRQESSIIAKIFEIDISSFQNMTINMYVKWTTDTLCFFLSRKCRSQPLLLNYTIFFWFLSQHTLLSQSSNQESKFLEHYQICGKSFYALRILLSFFKSLALIYNAFALNCYANKSRINIQALSL